MADYWKSQPRHFCEICKCWMAANKVSITMHEQGGRHKDNVQKRIRETSKRQAAETTREQDVKAMLEEMNRGALNGMIKDLAEDPNVAQRYGSRVEDTVRGKDVSGLLQQQEARNNPAPLPDGWEELRTEEGRPYFWHAASEHTQWERPLTATESDGQLRAVEAEGEHNEEKERVSKAIKARLEELRDKGELKEEEVEEEEDEAPNTVPMGPELAPSPYGRWEVVKVRPVKEKPPEEKEEKEEVKKEEPVVKSESSEGKLDFARPFKAFALSKRPVAGGSGTAVAFKKRKTIGNRNLRSREDEDD